MVLSSWRHFSFLGGILCFFGVIYFFLNHIQNKNKSLTFDIKKSYMQHGRGVNQSSPTENFFHKICITKSSIPGSQENKYFEEFGNVRNNKTFPLLASCFNLVTIMFKICNHCPCLVHNEIRDGQPYNQAAISHGSSTWIHYFNVLQQEAMCLFF